MRDKTWRLGLSLSVVWLGLSACATEEIGPHTLADFKADPTRGELQVLLAPTADSYDEQQARFANPDYELFLDGKLAFAPLTFWEGSQASFGLIPAGPHQFTVAAAGGGPIVFEGSAQVASLSVTKLYLFGPIDALQGRFVSYSALPATGTLHLSGINLVRGGPSMEWVSCADGRPCDPLSPPIGYGVTFAADFPAGATNGFWTSLATGGSIGYRPVPTPELPTPPVQPPIPGVWSEQIPRASILPPLNLVAAPIYLSAQGEVLFFLY
jgi:hypothetical protein